MVGPSGDGSNRGGFCSGYSSCSCSTCGSGVEVPPADGYSGADWDEYNSTAEGQNVYRWWADWIPTPDGQMWVSNKRHEARRLVDAMIHQWGIAALQSGEGVVEIGGDPGFVAAELQRSGVRVTLVDPAFGVAGKNDAATSAFLRHCEVDAQGSFRILREPFNEAFLKNPSHSRLFAGASAIVSLYPDDVTDFVIEVTAARALRTAIIPCNECVRFFPKHDPTYEGFVAELLAKDRNLCGQNAAFTLQRGQLYGSPFCQVILHRTPAVATGIDTARDWNDWDDGRASGLNSVPLPAPPEQLSQPAQWRKRRI